MKARVSYCEKDGGYYWEIVAQNSTVMASSDIVSDLRKSATRSLCRFLNMLNPKNPPKVIEIDGKPHQLRKDANGFYVKY